jgi:hypothetical protein
MNKICIKCNISKNVMEFNKDKNGKLCVKSKCKECISEYNKQRNKDKIEENKQYYLDNKEKINLQSYQYYKNNKEELIKKQTKYRKNNPDISRRSTKKWTENNPNYHNKYRKKRMKEDPCFRLRIILGVRLNELFKKKRINKNNSTIKSIGCSFIELKQHIELKFKPEMNWNNQGDIWEVDHIIPLSGGNTQDELYKLNHFTNLQPLFKTTKIANLFGYTNEIGNRNKSNKII